MTRRVKTPQLNITADILFLIDGSYSTLLRDFEAEKGFVKQFAKKLNLQPGKSRVALISYGEQPKLVTRFDGYKDVQELESLIDSAPFVGGPGRIDLALDMASSVLSGKS